VYNGETGALLFKSRTPGARRVSRQRLRALLAKDLDDDGTIRWGMRLAGLSEDGEDGPVQLQFEDGSTYNADYVLGADGSSSKVRELLFRDDEASRVRLSGFMFATVIAQYGDASKVEAVVKTHPVTAITMATASVGGCGGTFFPCDSFPRPICR
jgi:2-polyprenyl-6-methoxyphenol hydroxylase-like FAD-dependent oxidoreductase